MAGTLTCDFCWRMCAIAPEQRGVCGIREHKDGALRTVGYGSLVASGIDPIEKKPFYHVFPGSSTFSIALFGCNLACAFCQNHHISQKESYLYREIGTQKYITPDSIARKLQSSGSRIMSYTYSEPIVWQDYMLDCATIAHNQGDVNCMITNGSFSPSSLERVLPYIDAFNIDVKGDDLFYRTYCHGRLQPVLDAVEKINATSGKVLEVTTLIIEGIHDEHAMSILAGQLQEAKVKVWHLSRFFPHWNMKDRSPTSEACLERMLAIASKSSIPYIYGGNSTNSRRQATVCPQCRQVLMPEHDYRGSAAQFASASMNGKRCRQCGYEIYGLFEV